ncbi:tyrosine-type recombinase/integrase [Botrimarina mediterranea]|uniref:Phage integrase family protein n=1 Tax=Botrimarina mediterranea TaxID=2528022 RepID=A0A518K912_9BACT|nr:site-specific integrase [Botrimarina mediterranea]QDV74281.1 Phage integrase family protein [Botrimarina mediterranea]
MASLVFPKAADKGPSLQWYDSEGERRTLYLGKCPKRWAQDFAINCERLIQHAEFGEPLDRKTSTWLAELKPTWREKLAAKGLAEAATIVSIEDLVDDCLRSAIGSGVQPSTMQKLHDAAVNLFEYFGRGRSIHAVTPGDASDYAGWLRQNGRRDGRGTQLAASTTGKQLKTVSGFFRRAVSKEVARRNPFEGLAREAPGADAQQYIPREVVERVLRQCEPALALRVALTRFAGLRHPSEVEALELDWINLPERRLLAFSPKNQRHEHKRWREIPIDPTLAPYLEDAVEKAPTGTRYVAWERRGVSATAWRNALERACKRAAVVPWRSLWHSLRGSRANDLIDAGIPEHVVCTWQNTGPKELRRHYLRPTDEHFSSVTGLAAEAAAAPQAEPRVGARLAGRVAAAQRRRPPAGMR